MLVAGLTANARGEEKSPLDRTLRAWLNAQGVTPLDPGPRPSAAKLRLGQLLFFDKLLSGNRDTACATCHHPSFFTDDALSLSIGTGGTGLGPTRVKGATRPFVARNATDVFNRGSLEWTTMFWDMRVSGTSNTGRYATPAGALLPSGLESVLAAQAMFPVTGRDEMRGMVGDLNNELAALADTDFQGMWSAEMARILAIPAYQRLFADAYPRVPASDLGFQHAANAIAAFESAAFTRLDSPWDRYVAGDNRALNTPAKRGALLFYGRAGCVRCHSGKLFTDQKAHNIAVPQFGPGKAPSTPLDFGHGNITGNSSDRFTFRTPPLRNVVVTGPWMHNGAYTTLGGALIHHLSPADALVNYDVSQLSPELQPTVRNDPATTAAVLATLDPLVQKPLVLSDRDLDELMTFLGALTSPSLGLLPLVIPDEVPSGLPVDRLPEDGGLSRSAP
jgi:cytochrome c peroxidase